MCVCVCVKFCLSRVSSPLKWVNNNFVLISNSSSLSSIYTTVMTGQFPQFASLPGELQSHIWQASYSGSKMHVFDVCISRERIDRAFHSSTKMSTHKLELYNKYKSKIFLDVARPSAATNSTDGLTGLTTIFSRDPSIYLFLQSVAGSCDEASNVAKRNTPKPQDINMVYPPGQDQWVQYDNSMDVLALNFGTPSEVPKCSPNDRTTLGLLPVAFRMLSRLYGVMNWRRHCTRQSELRSTLTKSGPLTRDGILPPRK